MRKTKKELQRYVNELCILAQKLFPGAKVRAKPPYETEDVDIVVELPEDWRGGVARQRDVLIRRKLDILMETGYDIVVFVEKPNRSKIGSSAKKAKTKAAR